MTIEDYVLYEITNGETPEDLAAMKTPPPVDLPACGFEVRVIENSVPRVPGGEWYDTFEEAKETALKYGYKYVARWHHLFADDEDGMQIGDPLLYSVAYRQVAQRIRNPLRP